MQLCSAGHDEICYEGRDCPLCTSIQEIDDQQIQITKLEDEKSQMEDRIISLEDQLAEEKTKNEILGK